MLPDHEELIAAGLLVVPESRISRNAAGEWLHRMARDPEIERVHEALATAGRDEAERAITAGAALAVILAVAALIAAVAAAFWLFA